ncbi:MobC family replication-relaxation protein [uncultured Vibrio sp.]|uniref:MobC family replication-relaxation protein n=1 Tax=uncultured Vibrio sp. TaxID=114054 RepID=UPI002604A1CB|nr:MobC family replication-relaxation protein [uncultured Vibrio sp.]
MNTLPHVNDAIKRAREKEMIVLQFLHQEIYSGFNNFIALLKLPKSHTSALLKRMVKNKLIERHIVTLDTNTMSLWGITDEGILRVNDIDNAPLYSFTSSRFSIVTLNHTLMNQRVFIALHHIHWKNWLNADRQLFSEKYCVDHRPDAIVTSPVGTVMAIETELTFKTPARYRSIMKSHIQAKSKGFWQHVIYVVRDEPSKKLLSRRFDSIKFIPFDNSRHDFEKYRSMVSIFTVEEVGKLTQSK